MKGKNEATQRKISYMWQRYFENIGNTVINPFELADRLKNAYLNITGKEPTYQQYLQEDLCNLEWATHIFICDGWTESFGCMAEVDKAIEKGIIFLFEQKIKLE